MRSPQKSIATAPAGDGGTEDAPLISDEDYRELLGDITGKWVELVMAELNAETLRYSELARRVPGVSQKMLTQTLRAMERSGLITRSVIDTVPISTVYALTEMGRSLRAMSLGFRHWASAHRDSIRAAQSTYDRRED